jgi:hypothetical protein
MAATAGATDVLPDRSFHADHNVAVHRVGRMPATQGKRQRAHKGRPSNRRHAVQRYASGNRGGIPVCGENMHFVAA